MTATAVHELRLCEQEGLVLRPGQLYRFTVDESCKRCCELAAVDAFASSLSADQAKTVMR